VLGQIEHYTFTEPIAVEGQFDIAVGIGAFTVRLGEPDDSARGDYFEYYKPIGKQSFTVGVPRIVEPKWTKIGKDSIFVVPVDGPPPLPRGKAVEVVEAAPTKKIVPERQHEWPDTIHYSFSPDWGTVDTMTVGDFETESECLQPRQQPGVFGTLVTLVARRLHKMDILFVCNNGAIVNSRSLPIVAESGIL
jgi:hypothetical protein